MYANRDHANDHVEQHLKTVLRKPLVTIENCAAKGYTGEL